MGGREGHGPHLLPELEDRGGGILRGDIQGAVGPLELGTVLFSAGRKPEKHREPARGCKGTRVGGRGYPEGTGRNPPAPNLRAHTGASARPGPSARCVSVNKRDRTAPGRRPASRLPPTVDRFPGDSRGWGGQGRGRPGWEPGPLVAGRAARDASGPHVASTDVEHPFSGRRGRRWKETCPSRARSA